MEKGLLGPLRFLGMLLLNIHNLVVSEIQKKLLVLGCLDLFGFLLAESGVPMARMCAGKIMSCSVFRELAQPRVLFFVSYKTICANAIFWFEKWVLNNQQSNQSNQN